MHKLRANFKTAVAAFVLATAIRVVQLPAAIVDPDARARDRLPQRLARRALVRSLVALNLV